MNGANKPTLWARAHGWGILLLLTFVFFALGEMLRLPAAALLAGIAAGSLLALRGAGMQISRPVFYLGQSILGLMISSSFTLDVLHAMFDNWVMAIVIVMAVILFGLAGGMVITVNQWLPGTTGIWGVSPGGATAMIVMSEAYGGDMRLVAIMQYLRVMIVTAVAVGVARLLGAEIPAGVTYSFFGKYFPPTDYYNLGLTFAVALACCLLALRSRIPAASLLFPMCFGAVLHNTGLVDIELPGWLLTLAFMLIGWSIGLRFNRQVFVYAWKAMPKILGAIFFMMGSAGALAAALVIGWDIDPLTAYLATSPGGADAVAIIAASSGGDMVFIMAAQTMRLLIVILIGPYLARAAAHLVRKRVTFSGRD